MSAALHRLDTSAGFEKRVDSSGQKAKGEISDIVVLSPYDYWHCRSLREYRVHQIDNSNTSLNSPHGLFWDKSIFHLSNNNLERNLIETLFAVVKRRLRHEHQVVP
jgi:hypothetical protein